jgi:hypothetical protein
MPREHGLPGFRVLTDCACKPVFHSTRREYVPDEIIVECAEADAEAVMAEVQAIMETRSTQVFNGQKIGVEAHV